MTASELYVAAKIKASNDRVRMRRLKYICPDWLTKNCHVSIFVIIFTYIATNYIMNKSFFPNILVLITIDHRLLRTIFTSPANVITTYSIVFKCSICK